MGSKSHYVLKLFPPEDLFNLYRHQAEEHNLKTNAFLGNDEGHPDAGFDLYLPKTISVEERSAGTRIGLGVKCAMEICGSAGEVVTPVSYYLRGRSSLATRTTLRLANAVGVIDSGYRGEIAAVVDNVGSLFEVDRCTRLFQLCPPDIGRPMKIEIVDSPESLGTTERGDGGFGSTGL